MTASVRQLIRGACRRIAPVALAVLAAHSMASAQWPAKTLRDTLYVPANRMLTTQAKIAPGTSVQMQIDYEGTFSAFAGQDSLSFDAAYTYQIPGWSAPYPLRNPPGYAGKKYSVYPEATFNVSPVKDTAFGAITPQANHHYSRREWGTGARWQWRIYNRLDERPDGYYYSSAQGGLTIKLTQFTAGVAVKSKSIDFGTTNIGYPSMIRDSIQSYGLDPLRIDSIWIDGADAKAFSVVSDRGDIFSLPSEAKNELRITFSPIRTGYHDAVLHLHAVNADAPSRYVNISLRGLGASPSLAVGPKIVDFAKVRVTGSPVSRALTLYNSGNAELRITSISITPAAGTPAGTFSYKITTPFAVPKGNTLPVSVYFNPPGKSSYRAVMRFTGLGVADDSVVLLGQGGVPELVLQDNVLQFDTVYTGDKSVRKTRITNTGNWTANVISTALTGGSMSAFHSNPDDSKGFLLNAGESRDYEITFQPSTNTDGPHVAYLTFNFDDGAPSKSIQFNGYELKRRLAYSTSYIDFGRVKIKGAASRAVYVTNSRPIAAPMSPSWQKATSNPFQFTNPPSTIKSGVDSLVITFSPTSRGPASNWALFNSSGQRDSVMVVGTGAQPLAKFDPPIVNIGTVVSSQTGTNRTVLSDTGDFPLYVTGVRVKGADAADFTAYYGYKLTDTVREGGQDTRLVSVSFQTNERTGRTHHAMVEVMYNDNTTDSFEVVATEAAGHVTFATKSVDFGKLRLGSQDQKLVQFVNPMEIPLSVDSIWMMPANYPYLVSQSSTMVDPMKTASIKLTFAPTTRGKYNGWLHADRGDMRHDSIAISGIGAQSVAALSTTTIDFGSVALHSTSAPRAVTLSNVGDWPLAGVAMKLEDPYDEFRIVGPNGTIAPTAIDTVKPDSAHLYSVTFTPKRAALPDHRGVLYFTFDDGTTSSVTLVGRDFSNFLGVDSIAVDFGKVRIGAISQHPVHLINTSPLKLTADQLQIVAASAPFTANPNANVDVDANNMRKIDVQFKPTTMGASQALLVGQGSAFENQNGDTVLLYGIGAMPVPQLARTQIDFGSYVVGVGGTENTTLTNAGNWPLITHWSISGPNASDFTVHFAVDTTIQEGETTPIAIDFMASTPEQLTPRTATVTFTQDDGKTFELALIAHDHAAVPLQIGFGNYVGRPGDEITAYLRLRTAVPSSLAVQSLKGSVQFDPSIVTLRMIEAGSLVPLTDWTATITNQTASGFDYELTSTTGATLAEPGALLTLTFDIRKDVKPGGLSTLSAPCSFPNTREVAAVPVAGVILVDSACGSTHIDVGEARATFVLQNSPNPFGSSLDHTVIPFDVAADGATVTIRILDATGNEILRPLDHTYYKQGRYSVNVDAKRLSAGTYYYEFTSDAQKPQYKKMIVE